MSDIIQLKNPRTELYNEFKSLIKRYDFNWNYYPRTDEYGTPSMLSHSFIGRPKLEMKYPHTLSDGVQFAHDVCEEILKYNDITVQCYYRINLNMVLPQEGNQQTPVHVDHSFPHNNMIVYFTDGGKTMLENDEHDPKEDDVIIFPGVDHCHELPKNNSRVVLVATYI